MDVKKERKNRDIFFDAMNNPTTFTYDPITGNLILTTDPLGNTTNLTYDTAGNVQTSTDAEGRITYFGYDLMNRLTLVTDADNKTTSYQYDPAGNLTKVIDAKGNETQFIYNETNQLIQTINSLGISEYFKYDANRNLVAVINRNGDTITYGYDLANQLVKKFLPGNPSTFGYDSVGNLTSVIDPDSALSFIYDLANRLTSTSTAGSPSQPAITLTYGYDKNGNRTSMFDPTGTTSYAYDILNRLTSLTNPQNQATTFGYDNLSRRTGLIHANGTSTSYAYDGASQLTSLVNAKGVTTISRFDYTLYDKVGNRRIMQEESPTVPIPGSHNYAYDILNRIISAAHPQPENPAETFTYDPVGNRLFSHLSSNYRYDTANRLLEDDTYLYTYDNNGNLTEKFEKSTTKTTRNYYDAENQLIAITFPDGSLAEYRYDGLGRRIEKKLTPASGPIATIRYVYDNEDILLEYDGTNTLLARYTHGPGIDEPLVMNRAEQDYYYHVDGLGSVKEITDVAGTVVQSYTYDSFGRIVGQLNPSFVQPYTYTGREFDPESGLYYYRARYFDVNIGRFISIDPIKGLVLSPQSFNLYIYTQNNPILLIDPNGEIALVDNIIAAAIGGVINGAENALIHRTGVAFLSGFIGGAAGGFLAANGLIPIGGAITGGLTTLLNSAFGITENCNWKELAVDVTISSVLGGLVSAGAVKVAEAITPGYISTFSPINIEESIVNVLLQEDTNIIINDILFAYENFYKGQ